ncbi:MAG: hypothetical protein LRY50_04650, partial [Geovibrio sp.]|nr:hypothetical protein [Geovibrio sp.]
GISHVIDTRPDFLTDYERLLVKYLQVTYLQPKWIIIVSPRRMYAAEYEEKSKIFCVVKQGIIRLLSII